ncbi:RNA polymerase sigma factor [uncultured Pseudokineococcus sp.]|uniref:RNA polymerase sigma factor n=1 Tax=uncultured Pseudokineococcus sp. TaxID=1642928 RepID=UPI00261E92D6|nr:sigma-70 family RNA polymerase sigma factor [uncultured Pseudokineococcus sp.]
MDEEVYQRTFVAMQAQVLRYASRRCSRATAEEVVAETFAALWRGRDRAPDEPDGLRAWVFGIARRQLAQAQRKDRRVLDLGRSIREALQSGIPVVGPDPATQVVEADSARRVHDQLTPREQEVLQLVCWAGLSVEEVATALGASPSTVRTRLWRARQRLSALVMDDELLAEDVGAAPGGGATTGAPPSAEDLARRLGYVPDRDQDERAGRGGLPDRSASSGSVVPAATGADV